MDKKIITLKFCFLILFSCASRVDKKDNNNTVLFNIIFTNGFNSDEIILTINNNEIIKSVLLSDESDGVTSLAYEIVKKDGKVKLIKENEEKYVFNDNQNNIELTVTYKDKIYSHRPNKKMGKYILVELDNNSIKYKQQKEEPLFD